MDDMDAEAEEFGGERKFFAGDFARYGWAKLMRSGLGGYDVLNLYAEAIAKMPENPGIPPLFRDIFKNAYLPYRDPETLRLFLKTIDEFSYDHSERLGDAFEYLLSVLGSQGDAGQFRTPRHVIDFIVEVVNPTKTETVLDPACGTAGFLISSYKHILKANTDAQGASTLTPDERGRLAGAFKGYDISPDMVRLSLVNMYLHGFSDPHIFEYDTLTSDDRWNEVADVILANPPFMSPKGGIKPHKRFTVTSKRSEVLFVDYIAEHLAPNGRGGVIVPEGIIFQSQTAYTDLRKLLVEKYLVAVVSLPAGVFNPYSGVKTSILIFDKTLAKQTDSIAFFKVENDGFDLGAQRRPIAKNDVPQVAAELKEYLWRLSTRTSLADFQPARGLIVSKQKIAANGDYNLSAERYREIDPKLSVFPYVTLRDVCNINPEVANPAELYPNSFFNYIDISCVENETGRFLGPQRLASNEAPSRARRLVAAKDVLLSTVRPNLKAFAILEHLPERAIASTGFAVLRVNAERLLPNFLILILKHEKSVNQMIGMMGKGSYPSINQSDVESVEIPLPPIDVQREIVAEIEGYQKVIDGARMVLDNYRPHIPIDPSWPMVELGSVCEGILTGPFGSALHQSDYVLNGIPVVNPQNIIDGAVIQDATKTVSASTRERLKEFTLREHDIVIGRRGEMGRCAVVSEAMNGWLCGTGCFVVRLNKACDVRFAFYQLTSARVRDHLEQQAVGVTLKNLNQEILSHLEIPLPPLPVQQAIVAEIEAEQTLVNANRELIERFEKKIQAALARVWGEEETTAVAV
ncbi:MAG: N-6 DNA methylase [Anaerolineae bacterium]